MVSSRFLRRGLGCLDGDAGAAVVQVSLAPTEVK
jgi:hypothetical protein